MARPAEKPLRTGERDALTPAEPAAPDELMRTCPVCGKPLAERKCKLYCPDPVCGYFLSCADFY